MPDSISLVVNVCLNVWQLKLGNKVSSLMDTAIQTLRQNRKYVLNSAKFEYSNGPLEGINRKIKTLKRTCYGFANQKFFFLRIDCIFS